MHVLNPLTDIIDLSVISSFDISQVFVGVGDLSAFVAGLCGK